MFRSNFDHPQSTATTRLERARRNINTKHNKYNRHATTNPISLSLVTEVKEKKYLPEDGQTFDRNMLENFKSFKNNTIILMCCFNKVNISEILLVHERIIFHGDVCSVEIVSCRCLT